MNLTFIVSLRKILNLPGALDVAAIGFLCFFLKQASIQSIFLTIGGVSIFRAWLYVLHPKQDFYITLGKYCLDAILVILSAVYLLFFYSQSTYLLIILCAYLALSISVENIFLFAKKTLL